jgi:nitrogen-specific signal transduction histidine kinase
MRSILVLSRDENFVEAIRVVLDPSRYAVLCEGDLARVEALIGRGVLDAIIVDGGGGAAKVVRAVRELRAFAPGLLIYVYAEETSREWEEELFLLGVERVLPKPVRGALLSGLFDLKFSDAPKRNGILPNGKIEKRPEGAAEKPGASDAGRLGAYREIARLLREGDDPARLLEESLFRLRTILGINRAVIFLRSRGGPRASRELFAPGERKMTPGASVGVESGVLEHFALSLDVGIGEVVRRTGRILRASSPEVYANERAVREFSVLGATVALPVVDREGLLGIALFDDRITGELIGDDDLGHLFGVLEEIGRAIRNAWATDRVRESRAMLVGVLEHLASGCVLVGEDFSILHANASAKAMLGWKSDDGKNEYSDLPQPIGTAVFEVMKSRMPVDGFRHHVPGSERYYSVSVSPVQGMVGMAGNAVLLVMEEVTERERLHRLEVETAGLRLIQSMAPRLAHEIGNAVAPLSAHEQLIEEQFRDLEFRASLRQALSEGVRRITRLSNQMMYMASRQGVERGPIDVGDLVADAFQEAAVFRGESSAQAVDFRKSPDPCRVTGDRQALKQAFLEVFLNALQANQNNPKIAVRVEPAHLAGRRSWMIEVRDTGTGFSGESAKRAHEPFFTTRNVGVGLGLAVTRQIVEDHDGSLEIRPAGDGEPGVVRIKLPAEAVLPNGPAAAPEQNGIN